jgi:hypothetical protein
MFHVNEICKRISYANKLRTSFNSLLVHSLPLSRVRSLRSQERLNNSKLVEKRIKRCGGRCQALLAAGLLFILVRIALDLLLLVGYNNPFKGVISGFRSVSA